MIKFTPIESEAKHSLPFLTDNGSIFSAIENEYEALSYLEIFNFIEDFTKFKKVLILSIKKTSNEIFVVEVIVSEEDFVEINLDTLEIELIYFINSIIYERGK